MSKILDITGTITLNTPLHIAEAGNGSMGIDDKGKIVYGKGLGSPLTRTMRMPLPGVSQRVTPDDETTEPYLRYPRVPYISGNSIRGRLRRAAAARFLKQAVETGQKISRQQYHGLMSGASTTSPAGDMKTVALIDAAHNNPYMGS